MTHPPGPTPPGDWSISVTTVKTTYPVLSMDYDVHINGTVECGGCDPYYIGCSVDLQWPGLGGTNGYDLTLTAGGSTANQTWRESHRQYGDIGVWHWYVRCYGGDGYQRSDAGTFEVLVPPSP